MRCSLHCRGDPDGRNARAPSAPSRLARTVRPMPINTLLAVDGNSLLHRSYHALEASGLRTSDGRPTWAIKGFFSLLIGAVDRVGANALVVGFDDHTDNMRKTLFSGYKAQRPEKPEALKSQLALTVQTLRAAGVHVVVPPGLEADDVMASAAAVAAGAGWNTVIVTSDRDSFALIDDTTRVLRLLPRGGIDGAATLTADRLHTLTGVHPHQYREYAAIRGDSSDNLPGIRGVGEKSAAKLLSAFGSMDAVWADIEHNAGAGVAKAVGKSFIAKLTDPDSRAAYERNLELMTMRRDVDLGLDLTEAGRGLLPLDPERVLAAIDSLELRSLRSPVVAALCSTHTPESAPPPVPTPVRERPVADRVPAQPVPIEQPAGLAGPRSPRPASLGAPVW